jgi:hypothetical protein
MVATHGVNRGAFTQQLRHNTGPAFLKSVPLAECRDEERKVPLFGGRGNKLFLYEAVKTSEKAQTERKVPLLAESRLYNGVPGGIEERFVPLRPFFDVAKSDKGTFCSVFSDRVQNSVAGY